MHRRDVLRYLDDIFCVVENGVYTLYYLADLPCDLLWLHDASSTTVTRRDDDVLGGFLRVIMYDCCDLMYLCDFISFDHNYVGHFHYDLHVLVSLLYLVCNYLRFYHSVSSVIA